MWKQIIVAFLLVNAIFWGLFPHSIHCKFASIFMSYCPPHYAHVSFGVVCFLAAVVISQSKLFKLSAS